MQTLIFCAALGLSVMGYIAAASSGAADGADGFNPVRKMTVLLAAAVFLTLQAVAWAWFGASIAGGTL